MNDRKVTSCGDCPFLYQESEYPSSRCKLARQDLWPMGHYQRGPAPSNCPLRKGPARVTLEDTRRTP